MIPNFFVVRPHGGEFRNRFRWFSLWVVGAFGVLGGRLVQMQILQRDLYTEQARSHIVRRIALPTTRGIIYDAYGKELAANRPCHNVYVIPGRTMPSARRSTYGRKAIDTWPTLADLVQLSQTERTRLEDYLRSACVSDEDKSPCWRSLLIREDAPRAIVTELKQYQSQLPGLEIVTIPIRTYPYKHLAAHALGYVGELTTDLLERVHPPGYEKATPEERKQINPLGYELGDTLGVVGAERAWESFLRGQKGWEKRLIDARGHYRVEPHHLSLLQPPIRQEPHPGHQLRLTLDIELEKAVDRAMQGYRAGAVVVMETRTGKLLVLYSKPHYDPNKLAGGNNRSKIREAFALLSADPLSPMLERTAGGSFPPGSTFKPFTALAALEEQGFNPNKVEYCAGSIIVGKRMFRCTHMHGPVNLHQALAASCNVYFYKIAELIGIDRLATMAREFGFGAKTGFTLNPESAGLIPTRDWYTLHYSGKFQVGFGLNMVIGQGDTSVTLLQMAAAYSALANGGTLFVPQVLQSIETREGTSVQTFAPRIHHTLTLDATHSKRVMAALEAVVNDPHGTAYAVRDKTLHLAAKTGTAQAAHASSTATPEMREYYRKDHAWFTALFPAQDPEITLVVLLEHGGAGPAKAAPVGIQIAREYARLKEARAHTASSP